jgi:hypothetical protein
MRRRGEASDSAAPVFVGADVPTVCRYNTSREPRERLPRRDPRSRTRARRRRGRRQARPRPGRRSHSVAPTNWHCAVPGPVVSGYKLLVARGVPQPHSGPHNYGARRAALSDSVLGATQRTKGSDRKNTGPTPPAQPPGVGAADRRTRRRVSAERSSIETRKSRSRSLVSRTRTRDRAPSNSLTVLSALWATPRPPGAHRREPHDALVQPTEVGLSASRPRKAARRARVTPRDASAIQITHAQRRIQNYHRIPVSRHVRVHSRTRVWWCCAAPGPARRQGTDRAEKTGVHV